ncbi:MAG: DUF4118 domain-containing protein [Oscillospiraceae bacterium]|nr:DUF4118 domain-containing protein [Oscillospiraceae bacterium]
MEKGNRKQFLYNLMLFTLIMGGAVLLSMALSVVDNDNNPFAMAVFILAVALIARFTSGYSWGIAASLAGTFCVNYIFTYPFWAFDVTYPGYPLTVLVMLIVSILISTLTTQIKRQERMRFEAEREKMHANLLRAIAHDIRTPLSAMLGASSALLEQNLSQEDQQTLISGIHNDAKWLVRVTENLLSVTRLSDNNVTLKKQDEVLEEIIGSAILKYRRSDNALSVCVDEQEKILIVPMDGILIEQVFINLFDNVSVHAHGATQIWLHIQPEKDRILFSVEDNGQGIPLQRRQQVLNGGAQSDRSSTDDRRTMGIGLSVCATIIRAHGGEMTIDNSVHGGTAVRFYLPWQEETENGKNQE